MFSFLKVKGKIQVKIDNNEQYSDFHCPLFSIIDIQECQRNKQHFLKELFS